MKMHEAKTFGRALAGLLFVLAILGSASQVSVCGQEKTKKQPAVKKVTTEPGRDPFRKFEAPRIVVRTPGTVILVPGIQERINQYRAQRVAAMNAHVPAPKPTAALLLSEIQVIGISRTPRGYAAIVEATPIKLSYVIYPGERFYDGQLVAIEDSRLVFRHERILGDGKREQVVEMKSLRQANMNDAMTAAPAPAPAAAGDPDKKNRGASPDRPY